VASLFQRVRKTGSEELMNKTAEGPDRMPKNQLQSKAQAGRQYKTEMTYVRHIVASDELENSPKVC
jgi:hypothetical protein